MQKQSLDFTQELAFAKEIASDAGHIMLRYFGTNMSIDHKSDGSPITIADRKINGLVIQAVQKRFPDHAVIGEEMSSGVPHPWLTWVCDPIDGTLPYSLGIPINVFALAAVDSSGNPVVAVVYDPYRQRMYWAVKHHGAHVNDQKLRVNATNNLQDGIIGCSGRHSPVLKVADFKAELTLQCNRLLALHSAIYEAMLVASGQFAASVVVGSACYDAACAKLIIEEAGGRVSDVFGQTQRYDCPTSGAIISNGALHDKLVALALQNKAR